MGGIPIEALKNKLEGIEDAVFKNIEIAREQVTLIYFSSLVDKLTLHKTVIRPLLQSKGNLLQTAEVIEPNDLPSIITSITEGNTIVYFHKKEIYLKVNTFSAPMASITETDTESSVIGPQNAFTESLETNISLIKRRIQNPNLKSKNFVVGTETNTKISVMYIDDIVNKDNLDILIKKIEKIDHPRFNDITILQQLMDDHPYSPFPQYHETVRPDIAVSNLVDGRIVVVMDNKGKWTEELTKK